MNGEDNNLLVVGISFLAFISTVFFYTLSQKETFENSEGWKNKYKQPMSPAPKNWYYRFFKLKYREKFPLSGSLLVSLTDKYHFYQLIFKLLLCTSIVLYRPVLGLWDAMIYFVLWGMTFTLSYRK